MKAHKPLTERIGDALAKHGRCSLDELAKHVGTTKATLYTMMGKLKDEGIVRPVAGERGVYEAAKGAARTIEAPPAQAKKKVKKARRQKTGKKPAKRPRAVIPAEPPAPLNGEGAHFAIDEQGKLGIETREAKIALEPAEFERLRGFIERTKPVWQQDRG